MVEIKGRSDIGGIALDRPKSLREAYSENKELLDLAFEPGALYLLYRAARDEGLSRVWMAANLDVQVTELVTRLMQANLLRIDEVTHNYRTTQEGKRVLGWFNLSDGDTAATAPHLYRFCPVQATEKIIAGPIQRGSTYRKYGEVDKATDYSLDGTTAFLAAREKEKEYVFSSRLAMR